MASTFSEPDSIWLIASPFPQESMDDSSIFQTRFCEINEQAHPETSGSQIVKTLGGMEVVESPHRF
jgi:hypothetical protein